MAGPVSGLRIVFDNFPKIISSLQSEVGQGVQDTTQDIANIAQSIVPVLTGTLRDSITAEPTGQTSGIVGTDVRYAIFVETGSGHGPAQPYMAPAAQQGEPILVQRTTDAVNRAAGA